MIELERARHFLKVRHDGILATIKGDGRPQLSNILYFMDDDGRVKISVTQTRAKTHNLRRDPRASLHVQGRDRCDYVVFPGDGIGQLDAFDALKRPGHLDRLSRRRVDEHIRPHSTLLDEFGPQNTALAAGKMSIMTSMTAVVKATAGPGAEIDQVAIPEPKGK